MRDPLVQMGIVIIGVILIIAFTTSKADAELTDEYIKSQEVHYDSEFQRCQELLKYACELEGVNNYKLCIAVSRLETGNWSSYAFVYGHNWGGLTSSKGVMEFDTEVDGLLAYIDCFKSYESKGLTTAEEMQSIYCPGNSRWAELVNQIMKEVD